MRELKNTSLDDILFLDIETTRIVDEIVLDTPLYDSWEYKIKDNPEFKDKGVNESFIDRASLYPEFGKITCISCGKIKNGEVRVKSYIGDERELLNEFLSDLNRITEKIPRTKLCTHSGVGFDVPFIMKRCIVNGIPLHPLVDTTGLKPWELSILDLNVIWKSSSYSSASLINICVALGVPTIQTKISSKDLSNLYWKSPEVCINKIKEVCEDNVNAIIKIVLKCRGESIAEKKDAIAGLIGGDEYTEDIKEKLVNVIKESDVKDESIVLLGHIARKKNTKITLNNVTEIKEKLI